MATVRHRTIRPLPCDKKEALPAAVPATEGGNRSVLLEKCRAISTLEKSISTGDEAGEGTLRRRVISYPCDTQVYQHWRNGGQVV